MMTVNERVAMIALGNALLALVKRTEDPLDPGVTLSDRIQAAIDTLINEPIEVPGLLLPKLVDGKGT